MFWFCMPIDFMLGVLYWHTDVVVCLHLKLSVGSLWFAFVLMANTRIHMWEFSVCTLLIQLSIYTLYQLLSWDVLLWIVIFWYAYISGEHRNIWLFVVGVEQLIENLIMDQLKMMYNCKEWIGMNVLYWIYFLSLFNFLQVTFFKFLLYNFSTMLKLSKKLLFT